MKTIFISHISEEAPLASIIKQALTRDFGELEVFVSSDTESISAGDNWLVSVDNALRRASLQIILCSPVSVRRPWINFEAGAAWMSRMPVIPLCHTGMEPTDLPMPLAVLQAVRATDTRGLSQIYRRISHLLDGVAAATDFGGLLILIEQFEAYYRKQVPASAKLQMEANRLTLQRMKELLSEPKYRYRTLRRLAEVAAVSESEAIDLLRTDAEIVFGRKQDTGEIIARLRSR